MNVAQGERRGQGSKSQVPYAGRRRAGRAHTDLDRERKRLRPYVERAKGFTGWPLDAFAPTRMDPGEPWSYMGRASELLERARSVLDLGTGGGEILERLCTTHTGRVVATESWSGNAPVAADRLRPLGIHVVEASSLALPFRDASFDLVLDRHEELEPGEVARVLSPGGRILTQQVGRETWRELRDFFPRMADPGDLFRRYAGGLAASGLRVAQGRTHTGRAAYGGMGDVVFLLCIAPWTIPDFDPLGRDLPAVLEAEDTLSSRDGVVLTEALFLIEAAKDR